MEISILNVLGPVMIGPSSSHTAGAAKLSMVARNLLTKPFMHVSFGLYGSFAKTYKGHGTDIALVAGALGIREDDERLKQAFSIAKEQGISYDFYEVELENAHENTVVMTFTYVDGDSMEVVGSSIGGGEILIRKIQGFDTALSMNASTLLIRHKDRVGVIHEITKVLAEEEINIGVMTLNRKARGEEACCTIETDRYLTNKMVEKLKKLDDIASVQAINIE
ncbi:MAG: L-serine ammonia-lyase, iron-sulfur-dependent subunit beta [Velocimicrobium sp.]